jgi:hypothetical protein
MGATAVVLASKVRAWMNESCRAKKGKFTSEARATAKQAIAAQANARAQALLPIIDELRAAGVRSYRGIAAKLNELGIPTARGGRWAATQVRDIVMRSSLPSTNER